MDSNDFNDGGRGGNDASGRYGPYGRNDRYSRAGGFDRFSNGSRFGRHGRTGRLGMWSRRLWKLAGIAGIGAIFAGMAACSHAGPGRFGGDSTAQMDPDTANHRIDKAVNWVLSDVNATPDQKQKVSAIAKGAFSDLQPLRAQHREARAKGLDILSQPTVDRAALEQLRVNELQMAEQASRRLTQAMADIADTLTPEQRLQLKARIERRMGRRWS